MQLIQIGKKQFATTTGRITTDSYNATIKKLTFASSKGFVQIVPLKLASGTKHLKYALVKSLESFKNDSAVTKKPELEFILHFTAENQLNKALNKAKFSNESLVLICEKNIFNEIKKELNFEEQKIEFGKNKNELMKFYSISERELKTFFDLKNALEELIIQRCVFASFEK